MPLLVPRPGVRPGGRHTVRLAPVAYADAAVFVTVVTAARVPCLGRIGAGGVVHRTPVGEIVAECIAAIPMHIPGAGIDAWIVMPDHVHFVVWSGPSTDARADPDAPPDPDGRRGAACCAPTPPHHPSPPYMPGGLRAGSVSVVVRAVKSAATRRVNLLRGTPGAPLWQRGFHDHIVRDARDLARIRAYIATNPTHHAAHR